MVRITLAGRMSVATPQATAYEQNLASRQGRLLFAYLTLERAEPIPRDRLASLLWPEALPAAWEKSLVAVISRLRRALSDVGLPGDAISSAFGCYQMHLPPDVWVDVEAAEALLEEGIHAAASGEGAAAETAVSAAAAIARRSFLPGEEGHWVDARRASLRDLLLRSLETLAATASDPAVRVQAAEEALGIDAFREPAYRLLMAAHEAAGNRAASLRIYDRCRTVLAEELGVDPSPETESLYVRILREDGSDSNASRPDLAAPLAPAPGSVDVQANLPHRIASLVGREQLIEELDALVRTRRIVTLVGPGGIGKTTLALHVAREVMSSYDQVRMVELGPVGEPALVLPAVSAAFGISDEAEMPLLDLVTERLGRGRTLLLLDNCEHLIEAAAAIANEILGRCPGLTLLATSRERLGIAGEALCRVPPLAAPVGDDAPSPEALSAYSSVQLFVERAQSVRADFALTDTNAAAVATIVRELDGLPLALELAAARVDALAPAQIAERLQDRFGLLTSSERGGPERHRTLRSLIDWSYDLLSEDERRLLRRLSVFAGTADLGAIEWVCGEGALPVLSSLVRKSLVAADVHTDSARYQLHGTIKHYGSERLREAGEEEQTRERHVAYAVHMGASAVLIRDEEIRRASIMRRLADAHDEIRSALMWCIETGRVEEAHLIAGPFTRYWVQAGYVGEGATWIERVLAMPGASDRARSTAFEGAGWLALCRGRLGDASRRFDEALALYRRLGEPREESETLEGLSQVAMIRGDYHTARAKAEEALAVARAAGDLTGEGLARRSLADLASDEGDLEAAQQHLERALEVFEGHQPNRHAQTLGELGYVAWAKGELPRARRLIERCLESLRKRSDPLEDARWTAMLALIALDDGNHQEALELARAGLRLFVDTEQTVWIAWVLGVLGRIEAAAGRHERAANLLAAAHGMVARIGGAIPRAERETHDRAVEAARAALGEERFAAAWEWGLDASEDQAIALGLESSRP